MPDRDLSALIERVEQLSGQDRDAERLYEAAYACGLVNDLRHWQRRSGKDGEWDWSTPALDEATKDKWRKLAALLRALRSRETVDG